MAVLLAFATLGPAVPLADPENHELCRFDWSNADHTDQLPVVYVCLGHGGAIAFHEEGLFLLRALQHAVAPQAGKKVADTAPHPRPCGLVVDFEYHPLRAALYGLFNEDEYPPDLHVLPGVVG